MQLPPLCHFVSFSLLFFWCACPSVLAAPLFGFFDSSSSSSDSSSSAAAQPSDSPTSTAATGPTSFSPLGSASDVFSEGATCTASWTPDTSGSTTWKSMSVSLMTGSNLNMTKLATVATGLDGTNAAVTSYNYTCPQVSPTSAIYFLQYDHDGTDAQDNSTTPLWTTRFAIADPSGATVPPPNANQPEGGSPAIPWGEGVLLSAGNATTSASASSTPAATSTVAPSSTATGAPMAAATPAAMIPSIGGGLPPQEQMQSAFSAAFAPGTGPFNNADFLVPEGNALYSYRQRAANGALPSLKLSSSFSLGLGALAAGLGASLLL